MIAAMAVGATLSGGLTTPATAVETGPLIRLAAALSGREVYDEACIVCHGTGTAGAPLLGDVDDWATRLAQGEEVLADRALNGYTGDLGYMPPKGGRVDLSDEEILAALAYLLEQSR